MVELPEIVDGHAFDVRPVADRRVSIVVPQKRRRNHPLPKDGRRAVLASFELAANNGKLRRQVFRRNVAVDHAVGFELECELKVVLVARQCFVIVRSIEPGGTVEVGSAIFERLRHVGVCRRPFEKHVLQQVSHAGFAIAFVPRTDKIGHVDGDGRLGTVGKQQDSHAVVEFKLSDAFNRGYQPGFSTNERRRTDN